MGTENTGVPQTAQPPPGTLSSWENEGGAPLQAPQAGATSAQAAADTPALTNVELLQLRVRVIALENVVIALLAKGTDAQLRLISELAAHIAPRPGFTPHPLTIRASGEMLRLVDRATHFRSLATP